MDSGERSTSTRAGNLANLARELSQNATPSETLLIIRRALWEAQGPNSSLILSTRGLKKGEYRMVQLHTDGEGPILDHDPWANEKLPVQRGGLIGEIISTSEPHIVSGVDWANDPVLAETLAGYDSVAAIPFRGEHLPITWVILFRRSPEVFTEAELEQAVLRVALITSLLESRTLMQKLADAHELIERDVKRVGQIQRALFPNPLPEIPGLQIAASFETFGEAGGDLYDFIPLREKSSGRERWAIFIGDASGHGPSAAVVIAIVQALLHSHPGGVSGPGALLKHVNDHLCRKPIESSFVTAFVAVFDGATRELVFARAGHPPPVLLGKSAGKLQRLDAGGGYPLGIDADQTFPEGSVRLESGDAVLFYTDGIEEARDRSGRMLGIEGIEEVVRSGSRAPEKLIAAVGEAVAKHVQGRVATDDQTLVAIGVE